jgi:hypothetical protein
MFSVFTEKWTAGIDYIIVLLKRDVGAIPVISHVTLKNEN